VDVMSHLKRTEEVFVIKNLVYIEGILNRINKDIEVVAIHKKRWSSFIGKYGPTLFYLSIADNFRAYHRPEEKGDPEICFSGQCIAEYGSDFISVDLIKTS
jgi:hypothetical protein